MPDWKQEITNRLRPLKLAPAHEAAIVEELAQHLEDRYQELVAGGATDEDARCLAREELSDDDLLARGLRRVQHDVFREPVVQGGSGGNNFVARVWQDVRYGVRMLCKNARFTALAVMTLALGIGANTAIFSVVNAVLLRPLPYPDPGQLVVVGERWMGGGGDLAPPDYLDIAAENHVFEQMAAYRSSNFNLSAGDRPERVSGAVVTINIFNLLGVKPILGRSFLPALDQWN